ncbi:hypothetical protein [Saliphagus infecundisoli]|uniref:Uncharacterized protein n=1 Tax=Saliphagus infecundisoli TaxID=1849069 RepID=A0ABD5QAD5_9EURY|nr:hypothetical protein [Saliphagus infecundisoli]
MQMFGGGIVLLTIVICSFLYFVHEGLFEPEFGSAVVTSMLVLVTAVSVFLTLLLVKENKTARERENKPVFTITTGSIYSNSYQLAVENIGNGPAQNVDITMTTEPDNIDAKLERKNVRPGDICLDSATHITANHIPERYKTVSIKGTCEDIFGNEVEVNNEAKVENITGNEEQVVRSEIEELGQEIKGVSSSIDSLFDNIHVKEIDSLVKMENSKRVTDCLKENGALTIEELVQNLGLHYTDLLQTLIWLDSAGSIEYDKESITDIGEDKETEIKLSFGEK